jgi:mono/diheme cytochrome c family protein
MFERMLIGSIENRITVGILAFVGMMILLGWAAINEGGRMAAFQQMEEARSIELGAYTYASNCSTCHGPDGRGGAGRAPALNNPQFFGHDFFPEITAEITSLRQEKTRLNLERGESQTTDARKAEIDTRITEIDAQIEALNIQRTSGVQAAVERGYNPDRFDRLSNVGWVGTREAFVITTLVHGRPASVSYWPQGGMVAWAQTAGGPLRMDQIEDLTAYILNWDKGDAWTVEDLFAVNQFAIEPIDPTGIVLADVPDAVGTDVAQVVADLAMVQGDPARGDRLYHGTANPERGGGVLGCSGCHLAEANGTGPMTAGTFTRASGERLQDPALAGYTPDQYIVESILMPGNYIVPNFTNVMLANFGDRLTLQDLADLVAYLETQNQ